jgi:hypothetical protein
MRVVIGSGADGLRAAAALAASGASVLLLQETETPHGLVHPDMPEGTGRLYVDPSFRTESEAALGPLVEAPAIKRAVSIRGEVHSVPMALSTVPRLFDGPDLGEIGRRFVSQRIRNSMIPLTGGGQEERTYRQWVERRMGAPAYNHVYADYAQRRWGLPGDQLSVAVARVHHNPHRVGPGQVAGGGPAAALAHAVAVIESNGGEIRCGARVRGLKVVDGKVTAVRVGRRNVPVDGPLWIARPHSVVAGWLGDALTPAQHVDASALRVWDRVQLAVPVGDAMLADEIHVLEPSAPAWRVTQEYGGTAWAVFHTTLQPDAPTPTAEAMVRLGSAMGMRGLDPTAARVERLKEWAPLWAPVVHPRLRRMSLAWSALGIVAVGRRGTFTSIDPGTELAVAISHAAEGGPDEREVLRSLLEPPVKDNDLDASFRDFIWS